jgi:hypothetical protein
VYASTPRERLRWRLIRECSSEIAARGGETDIDGRQIHVIQRFPGGLTLVGCQGWRQYSRRFGSRRASLAYLCGRDDNGTWAVRVPGTCGSIGEAVAWVEPAAVKAARQAGRRVLRQGDVYAVEARRDDASGLPPRHRFDAERRLLLHLDEARPHAPLHVPFPARFFAQRVYQMGRSGRRAGGD